MRAVLGIALALVLTSCGADPSADSRPSIVVTTSILGDVVQEIVGDGASVEVVMPRGADPHDFAPSARQAEAMAEADLLVVNGAGFEAGLVDGARTFTFTDHVELLGSDPHFWMDPTRMASAVEALGEELATIDGLDADTVRTAAAAYAERLRALDAEVEGMLSGVPDGDRVLVTNHEVLGYFADRYGFEVIGAVIPAPTTGAEASARDLEELADVIRAEGVPAIFAETTSSSDLAEALADIDRAGERVEVIELHTESLGEPGSGAETYVDLVRTDATLIAGALAKA